MDEDGFVYVFDRKKDMINRGGFKIFSAEVESVLASHPGLWKVRSSRGPVRFSASASMPSSPCASRYLRPPN